MAHFAELNDSNIVQRVIVVEDAVVSDEAAGIAFLQNLYGADTIWKQTSYNTYGKKHYTGALETSTTIHNTRGETLSSDQSKAFRLNYAGLGYTYDTSIDGFCVPKPDGMNSWVLDNTTGCYNPPVDYPTITTYEYDGQTKNYQISWDETNVRYVAYDKKDPVNNYRWDASALVWIII